MYTIAIIKSARIEQRMALFFILSVLRTLRSLFAMFVSPQIEYKFLRTEFCILSDCFVKLNLISLAMSSQARPTDFAYSKWRLFSRIIPTSLFSKSSISCKKKVMSDISYDFIFVFFSRSHFTGRLGILDLPKVPSDSLKGILGCPHAFSYLIITHVIHLFDLHLLQQLLCLVEFERVAYENK